MTSRVALLAVVLCLAACSDTNQPAQSARYPQPAGVEPGYGVDFRAAGWTGPVMNQQFVGSCSAFGLAATMNSLLRRSGRREDVSVMHVWAEMKHRDGMTASLVNVAVAPREAWAYDPVKACLIAEPGDPCADAGYSPGSGQLDPRLNLEWMHANVAERYRITAVDDVYDVYDVNRNGPRDREAIFALLAQGQALDGIVLVADGFEHPGPILSDYDVNDRSRGGHAVSLVGFRRVTGERQILLQNSWGRDWGDGGFVWLPERLIGKQLTIVRSVAINDARAPIAAAHGQCDGWHHLDVVLDACFSTCRNHLPTVNGRCNPLPRSEGPMLGYGCVDWRDVLAGKCRPPGTAQLPAYLPAWPWTAPVQ